MDKDLESVDLLSDHLSETPTSASSSAVVEKDGVPLPWLALFGLCIVAVLGFFVLAGQQTQQIALSLPTTTSAPTTTLPEVEEELSIAAEDRIPLPDRGGMRSIVEGWLTTRCADIIDGPEPLLNNVYEEHLACIESEMEKLEETCYLAARHYYQYPGEEALEIACAEPLPEEPSIGEL